MEPVNNNAEQTTLKVVIRVRPLNRRELENGNKNVWSVDTDNGTIELLADKNGKMFSFDRIYSLHHLTKDIYNETMLPVIQKFVKGFNGTIFAYGQTSSGKTYTMMGSGKDDGVIHRAIKYIFSFIRKATDRQFFMKMSYLEIYNESIKDMLDPKRVDLKISMDEFHRPFVRNLSTKCPASHTETFNILKEGMANRNIGATKLNDQSSRSHTIFQINLESREARTMNANVNDEQDDMEEMSTVRSSVLNIVDLAGSERAKKTEATGMRLKEAGNINTSLLTLGIVIRKLSEIAKGKNISDHIPYRDSKLTHILEPALGGNSKTVVICTMAPADVHAEESLSTLGFASRAKEVKNCASVVEMRNDAELIMFQKQQIQQLRQKLFQLRNEPHAGMHSGAIEHSSDEHGNHKNLNDSMRNMKLDNFAEERQNYEKQISRLKEICRNQLFFDINEEKVSERHEAKNADTQQDEDVNVNLLTNSNITHRKSMLGKRRHSVAFDMNGTPARKRLKVQLQQNMMHSRCENFSTPMNKIRIEKEEMEWKLRNATNVRKSLQQELRAQYKDFTSMQRQIDNMHQENTALTQKIAFYESALNENENKDQIMQNQKLHLKVHQMQQALKAATDELRMRKKQEIETKLRDELQHSHQTINQLHKQIAELRLNIEKQQQLSHALKMNRLSDVNMNAKDSTHEQSNVILQMSLTLHKLHSQLILIKNDRMSIHQSLQSEKQKFDTFTNQCMKGYTFYLKGFKEKLAKLRNSLEESNSEKRMFESQYRQLLEERDELREELESLRRPPDEIIDELQCELLNIQKQQEIDMNHISNIKTELENKMLEIEHLKQLGNESSSDMQQREQQIIDEYTKNIQELQLEIVELKQLNKKLESSFQANTKTVSLSKIESMNPLQLKDTIKSLKRSMRELQRKVACIERNKDLNEKTAHRYNKRCNDLSDKYKRLNREHTVVKSALNEQTAINKRLEMEKEKLLRAYKSLQSEQINAKDLNRKINITTKRLESLQKKYEKLSTEHDQLKQEKISHLKEIETLKSNITTMQKNNHKLEETRKSLEQQIAQLSEEKANVVEHLSTEKDVVERFKNELTKCHQTNQQQNEDLEKAAESLKIFESEIESLNANINGLNARISELTNENKSKNDQLDELNMELTNAQNDSADKINSLETQNESLKVNLSAMREFDAAQRNEIDETHKMFIEIQNELKVNKAELAEYQNRWQDERKQNDECMEKLRGYELKTSTLLHQVEMNRGTIESKTKEIDRLNTEFKEQQHSMLKTISELADTKARMESFNNEIDKLKQENVILIEEKNRLQQQMESKQQTMEQIKDEYNSEKETLQKELAEYKQGIQQLHHQSNSQVSNSEKKANELRHEINDCRNKIQQINKKYTELQEKYDSITQRCKQIEHEVDEKDNEILELNDQIEDLHIKFEKEQKELQCKLNKKITDLDDASNALCELQKEFNAQANDMKENENLQRQQNQIHNRIECERNSLQIQHTQLIKKYENATLELKSMEKRLKETENKLKDTFGKLRQTTLQNERIKDDLDTIASGNDRNILERKYAKLKQECNKRGEIIEQQEEQLNVRKQQMLDYKHAYKQWEAHSQKLHAKVKEQQQELQNLRPSKAKTKVFTELCKNYHYAKSQAEKAMLVCRQTQTDMICMRSYKENEENNNL